MMMELVVVRKNSWWMLNCASTCWAVETCVSAYTWSDSWKQFSMFQKADTALLAQFYYADEDLCLVAAELDSFDGRKNPARCAALVAQLRQVTTVYNTAYCRLHVRANEYIHGGYPSISLFRYLSYAHRSFCFTLKQTHSLVSLTNFTRNESKTFSLFK